MAENHKLPNSYVYGWMNFETSFEKDIFGYMMYVLSLKEVKEIYSKEEHFIEFDANEMLALTKKDNKPNKYREAVDSLMDAKLKFIEPKTKDVIFSRVISSARFIDGTTRIKLEVPQVILPKLIAGANNYTLIDLEIIMGLRSKYAKRLYELLCMFRTTGHAYFELMDFRGKMGTIDLKTGKILDYESKANFRRRVIEPAVKEICDNYTDFNVEWKRVMRGRLWVGVEFTFDFKAYQTRIPFERLIKENPNSELGALKQTLNKFGITASWQVDFILAYRRNDINQAIFQLQMAQTEKYNRQPSSCGRWLAEWFGCLSNNTIAEWKIANGVV